MNFSCRFNMVVPLSFSVGCCMEFPERRFNKSSIEFQWNFHAGSAKGLLCFHEGAIGTSWNPWNVCRMPNNHVEVLRDLRECFWVLNGIP